MPDLKLFRITEGAATELEGSHAPLEKHLQRLVEANMETLLGVRFLASEHSTGPRHGGRIDSLGIDENGSPVIVEYKRKQNDNVINQGLFYLDWLMDHRAEFENMVRSSVHRKSAGFVDWSTPRLICVATDFSWFDRHAVQQIDRAIDLVACRHFGEDLLALTLVHSNATDSMTTAAARRTATALPAPRRAGFDEDSDSEDVSTAEERDDAAGAGGSGRAGILERLEKASPQVREMFEAIVEHCETLGDDVSKKTLRRYVAFRRLKNFAWVKIHHVKGDVTVLLTLDPDTVELEDGFTRDLRGINHGGHGDLEVRVSDPAQLEDAYALIDRAYENC